MMNPTCCGNIENLCCSFGFPEVLHVTLSSPELPLVGDRVAQVMYASSSGNKIRWEGKIGNWLGGEATVEVMSVPTADGCYWSIAIKSRDQQEVTSMIPQSCPLVADIAHLTCRLTDGHPSQDLDAQVIATLTV